MKNHLQRDHNPFFRKIFRLKILLNFLIVLTLLSGISASALADEPAVQQATVSGTISDEQTGEPMPGVNIVVKGSTIGTITDVNGKYSISVPDKNATLVFTFIGYVTKEVAIGGKSVIDATLS